MEEYRIVLYEYTSRISARAYSLEGEKYKNADYLALTGEICDTWEGDVEQEYGIAKWDGKKWLDTGGRYATKSAAESEIKKWEKAQ